MAVENVATELGKPGRLQVTLYILLCCNSFIICWNHLGMAFMGATTKHHCSVGNSSDIDSLVPMIRKDGKEQWDSCHLFADRNKTGKMLCNNGWTYYQQGRENTIMSQWDLVCDDKYKGPLSVTIYFCGVMLGGLVFGPLADKFGRKPVLLFTLYTPAFLGVLIFFLDNYYVAFVILRFMLGFLFQGLQASTYIFIVELFAVQYRSVVGTVQVIFWALGVMSLALVSYAFRDWRYIQLFITIVAVLQIHFIWFLPESFRWLLSQKRFEKAEHVVTKISQFNKLPFPRSAFDEVVQKIDSTETTETQQKYTVIDMFRIRVLRLRSAILSWLWFSASVGYYGIALNISSLAGNKYLNFFISGLFELFAYIITVFIAARFGRRRPLFAYLMIGSLMCITAGVLAEKKDDDTGKQLTTALAIIGKFGFAGGFSVLFIFTSELFPTVIRNVGLGACAASARFGGVVAPQILLLGSQTRKSVPFILFGCCAFFASLVCLLLPETLKENLVDTIAEAKQMKNKTQVAYALQEQDTLDDQQALSQV